MKRWLASFLVIGFILWIMPLGYFIKPSQEKLACDGQRAMCMCCMMKPKVSDKAMEAGINLKVASSSNKESSSGGGNYFTSARSTVALNALSSSIFENKFLSYKNPFLASFEYVPKF